MHRTVIYENDTLHNRHCVGCSYSLEERDPCGTGDSPDVRHCICEEAKHCPGWLWIKRPKRKSEKEILTKGT